MSEIVEKFANRLNTILTIRNMKPVELHEKTGISESLISKYLSDNAVARLDKLTILSDVLSVNPVWLMGYDVPMEKNASTTKVDKLGNLIVEIPLLGIVKAGYDYLAQENWIGSIDIDKKLADTGDFFALKVKRR